MEYQKDIMDCAICAVMCYDVCVRAMGRGLFVDTAVLGNGCLYADKINTEAASSFCQTQSEKEREGKNPCWLLMLLFWQPNRLRIAQTGFKMNG